MRELKRNVENEPDLWLINYREELATLVRNRDRIWDVKGIH